MLIWQLSKSVSSLIEWWHRFQASLILMKWNNCFPLVSPDELEGCRWYWTPHLSWFNYNCKLFQYFEHLNQVGLIIITFQLHLQDEIKLWRRGERKRVIVRKRRGGGGKKQEMQPLVFGRGHLLHSRDSENGRRECVCFSSCPVCARGATVCVNSCVLLSLKEKEGGRCFEALWSTVVQRWACEMFASRLDSCENASPFYSCHVRWRQIKRRFIYFLVKSNASVRCPSDPS